MITICDTTSGQVFAGYADLAAAISAAKTRVEAYRAEFRVVAANGIVAAYVRPSPFGNAVIRFI